MRGTWERASPSDEDLSLFPTNEDLFVGTPVAGDPEIRALTQSLTNGREGGKSGHIWLFSIDPSRQNVETPACLSLQAHLILDQSLPSDSSCCIG